MPLGEIQDLADCFNLTAEQQNAAIYYLIQESKAQREVDKATVEELKKISAAVESLKQSDMLSSQRWSLIDKLGAVVLMFCSSALGGLVVWILDKVRG